MTEQPTEQAWLGNVAKPEAYLRNGHLIQTSPLHAATKQDIRDAIEEQSRARALATEQAILDELATGALPAADLAHDRPEPDLWLDAEGQTHRALVEIQDGNINAGIAYLQAALAFAQNHRHSLTEVTAR